ncbi:MAG: hypothetical protein FJX52_12585, partial [Alphaproteobacteria bacterium]|nr:hypothetical protein [Alphaproteobacteria bacterium]
MAMTTAKAICSSASVPSLVPTCRSAPSSICTVISRAMIEAADVLVTFKEYLHTDVKERAYEVFRILADQAVGKVKPRIAMFDCRMLGVYHPTREPIKSFL